MYDMDVPVAFLSPSFPTSTPSGRLSTAKRCHRRRPRPSVIVSSGTATGTGTDYDNDTGSDGLVVKDGESLDKFRAAFFSQPPDRFRQEEVEESGEDRVLQKLRNQVEDREYSSEHIASLLLKSTYRDVEDEETKSIWEEEMEAEREVDEYEELRKKADAFFAAAEEDDYNDVHTSVGEKEIESYGDPHIAGDGSARLKSLGSKLTEIQSRRSRIDFREVQPTAPVPSSPSSNPSNAYTRLSVFESMKNAEVITAESAGYNAITRVAERIANERYGFPFIPKPILPIEDAFRASKSVACMMCTEKFVPEDDDSNGEKFCTKCYVDLFLKNDPVTNAAPEERNLNALPAEVRKEVERVWSIRRKRKGGPDRSIPARRQRSVWQMAAENTSSPSNADSDSGVITRSNDSSTGMGVGIPGNGVAPPPVSPFTGRPTRAGDWNVLASHRSLRTINPIRNLVQEIDVVPNPGLDLIKLSVGDPTVYGNLKVSERFIESYCAAIKSGKHNGYSLSYGSLAAREAVAKRYTREEAPLTPDDVVLSSGTSGALELCIGSLCNEGDNILLARPGFPLFATIAGGFGVECRYYNTLPNQRWEINLENLENIIDGRTAAIVVNNPSNPCGSVYSKEHILEILEMAERFHLPVIADEVYADMAFSGTAFHSIGSLSKNVPVLSVGGISKQFVVPGWRLGWVCIHDRNNILDCGNVRKGMRQLTTRMLVPNSPAQACIPEMLSGGIEDKGLGVLMETLEMNAQFTVKALQKAPGIRCIAPQGAMYTMAELDTQLLGFKDDMDFTKTLLKEESVFVLPGQCFQAPNFIRIVFCAPQFVLSEAFHRMRRFCKRHAKAD